MKLHVDRSGAGPDLALLHGWAMHSGIWADLLAALGRRYRVHAVDLPGHGGSAGAAVGALDEAARAVAEVVPEASIVCAWSLGGLVAQRLALRHRTRVRALVLVSSTPCFAQRPDWPHAMAGATLDEFASGLCEDPQATLRRFVRLNALDATQPREAIRALECALAARAAPDVESLRRTLSWLRGCDLRADAARIEPPARIVHGGRDRLVPVEAGRWLASAMPHARLLEIPEAAHLPFFTHRDAFLESLEGFDG